MIRYYITDGSGRAEDVRRNTARLVRLGAVDWIQIREKSMPARELYRLVAAVVAIARPAGVRVLVNERADIAIAAGADGVHLPSHSIAPGEYRKLGCRMIGVSCHTAEELADAEGADFAVLGPVFAPISKASVLPPLGLETFSHLARSARIPVLALGGITRQNADACIAAGAAGIAGISLFNPEDPAAFG